ncbi:MAG: 23S rRNA methyltransferase, partial [Magnetococcales bacterium]|nr:23S rRNA methyltransferase [Magnetococcales bacterium]
GEAVARVDVVLSDMAPNMSGVKAVDQLRCDLLSETAMQFAEETLVPGGSLILKLFHGSGFQDLVQRGRDRFRSVRVVKPKASRPRSPEHYLVGVGFQPGPSGS